MARRRQLLRQTADETLLRFGPEERGLARLLRESRANLRLGIRAEEATAAGVKASARHARPLVRRSYARAGESFDQADRDIKVLGGSSSDAAVREAAGARRRMAEALADAETELSSREVDAEAGRAYGVQQRRRQYESERGKIIEDRRDLRREEGLYASSTFRDLSEADAKMALERRRIRVSVGNLRARRQHDRVTENQAQQRINEQGRHNRQTEKDGGKKGGPTRAQRVGAREDWGKAWSIIQADKPKKDQYASYMKYLVEKGVPLPIARGVWQKYRLGGTRRPLRRKLRRVYGLHPKPAPRPTHFDPSGPILGALGIGRR